jgi:hypothetical protein
MPKLNRMFKIGFFYSVVSWLWANEPFYSSQQLLPLPLLACGRLMCLLTEATV